MAAMTTADRIVVGALFQEQKSMAREAFGALTKADVQAACAAIDDWIVANTASFNSAIPLPARTALTATQKTDLFVLVLERRKLVGA